MDKPITLSIKDWLIRNMSIKIMVPERTIECVVNHQFNSAYEALNKYYSLEFSGFGKFYFNRKKAGYKMKKYLDIKEGYEKMLSSPSLTEQAKHSLELKMNSITRDIETLKLKTK